jgi:putative acetyltransferase
MIIRPETSGDVAAIGDLVRAAFARHQEAGLVDGLRRSGDLRLSLVAEEAGRVIGHVGFSRVWISRDGRRSPGVSLAPLAVAAERRRRGVGAELVEAGHADLRAAGESICFVLGDPAYYGRFGYAIPAAAGFDCAYAGAHFQALRLISAAPESGTIVYAAAFAGLK